RDTPLIHSEWNIAPVPPYPEGNLNANEVGAAYVAANLLAMHETGVNWQIFLMYTDPGVKGYFGGTFTESGIPRANYNTFRLFARLKGAEVSARSSDPWVGAAAFRDDANLYVIVSSLVPTPKMTEHTEQIQNVLVNAEFTRSVASAVAARKKSLPEPLARKAQAHKQQAQQASSEISRKAAAWKNGLTLEIALSGMSRAAGKATHYLIDSKHSNIYNDLAKAERHLAQELEKAQKKVMGEVAARLQSASIPQATIERLQAAAGNEKAVKDIVSSLPERERKAVTAVAADMAKEVATRYSEIVREIEN